MRFLILCLSVSFASTVIGQELPPTGKREHQVPVELRNAYLNLDGSCVLDSLGIGGIHANDPKAAYLPFNSPYGPAERGGADPDRVARICNSRGIKAWNVTGEHTVPMARWAVATGRACAIGFDTAHFQTLWGYDYDRKLWLVCDNRCPEKITEYTEEQFLELHNRVRWCVVLERPKARIPTYSNW